VNPIAKEPQSSPPSSVKIFKSTGFKRLDKNLIDVNTFLLYYNPYFSGFPIVIETQRLLLYYPIAKAL